MESHGGLVVLAILIITGIVSKVINQPSLSRFNSDPGIVEMNIPNHYAMTTSKGKQLIAKGETLFKEALDHPALKEVLSFIDYLNVQPYKWQLEERGIELLEEEIKAVMCYTTPMSSPEFYDVFSTAVKDGNENSFPIIYRLLGQAIGKLRKLTPKGITVYRGTYSTFSAELGSKIRFGSFISTSANRKIAEVTLANGIPCRILRSFCRKESVWYLFFATFCKERVMLTIHTRGGAKVRDISMVHHQEEVVIPPHEVFLVESIAAGEVHLRSIGTDRTLKSSPKLMREQ